MKQTNKRKRKKEYIKTFQTKEKERAFRNVSNKK
jgi:hypothetical protein